LERQAFLWIAWIVYKERSPPRDASLPPREARDVCNFSAQGVFFVQLKNTTNMNNNLFSISSILAASAALVTATVGIVASVIAFTVVGVLAIFALDYRRTLAPISLPAEVVPFNPTGRSMPEMQLAA